jgi:hypothetical protein
VVVVPCGATVVVVVAGAGECTPGAVVGGTVEVGVTARVMGGAGEVVEEGSVVVVVEAGLVVVVGTLVMVKPPPGLGSTTTPWAEVAASVRTPSHSAPSPTNRTNSNTVVRRILIRSDTGPRDFDTMLGSFAINQGFERWGEPASESAPA